MLKLFNFQLFRNISQKRFNSSLVLIEHNENKLEKLNYNVINAALKIGKVSCLVSGSQCRSVAEEVANIDGVSKVILADKKCYMYNLAETLVPLALKTCSQIQATHIFAPCSVFGKNLLPRISCKLNVSPINDVIEILNENTFKRPIYAGSAIVTLQSLDAIKCLTVRSASFTPSSLSSTLAPIIDAPDVGQDTEGFEAFDCSDFISTERLKSDRPELGDADVVVSGGRGLKSGEHFQLIYELADKLNGAVGASRAAVDAGYVPNDLQVGQTGKVVAPKLYIAVGISGAIQHLAGMKDSKVIVAINKDADAPIFQIADYGLVDDLFKVVPELISKL